MKKLNFLVLLACSSIFLTAGCPKKETIEETQKPDPPVIEEVEPVEIPTFNRTPEYQFKSTINKNHLNKAGITHGGYIASLIDAGSGTAVHRSTSTNSCVTVSLDIKFIAPTKESDQILGFVKILKKTKSMVFVICHLQCKNKIIASASGVWKILKA